MSQKVKGFSLLLKSVHRQASSPSPSQDRPQKAPGLTYKLALFSTNCNKTNHDSSWCAKTNHDPITILPWAPPKIIFRNEALFTYGALFNAIIGKILASIEKGACSVSEAEDGKQVTYSSEGGCHPRLACLLAAYPPLPPPAFAAKPRRLRPAVGRPAKPNSPATNLFTYGRLCHLGCRRGHATQQVAD